MIVVPAHPELQAPELKSSSERGGGGGGLTPEAPFLVSRTKRVAQPATQGRRAGQGKDAGWLNPTAFYSSSSTCVNPPPKLEPGRLSQSRPSPPDPAVSLWRTHFDTLSKKIRGDAQTVVLCSARGGAARGYEAHPVYC